MLRLSISPNDKHKELCLSDSAAPHDIPCNYTTQKHCFYFGLCAILFLIQEFKLDKKNKSHNSSLNLIWRHSLHGSCCWVTPTGCGKGAHDGLTSISRCCERLHLNFAQLLASLFHLRAKFGPSWSLTCPHSCCVCSLVPENGNPSLPLSTHFYLWPLFPFLSPCRNYYIFLPLFLSLVPWKKSRPFVRAGGWAMLLQLLSENQEGCRNSQCCQLCAARKAPFWKIINHLVYHWLIPYQQYVNNTLDWFKTSDLAAKCQILSSVQWFKFRCLIISLLS